MHQDLPPIDALACFVAAARSDSFRQAARSTSLSASAFGQRIRQLEDHVQVVLFERTTRRVTLSDAGRRLLPRISAVLASIAQLPSAAHDESAPVPRALTIGTRHELGLSWLNPMRRDLERAIPGLALHLYFSSGADFWELLEARRIDAVVSSARLPARRFSFAELHEEHYVMVASAKLVQRRAIRSAAALAEHVLVDADPGLPLARYWLDAEASRGRLQFRQIRCLGTIAAVRDDVAAGGGVAVLPEYFVRPDLEAGRLRRLFPSKRLLSDHFRLISLPNRVDADVIERIAAAMRDCPLR